MVENGNLASLLPSADEARKYEEIQPGFLQWQMDLIKQEAEHARQSDRDKFDYDKERLRLELDIIKRGQWFGLGIGVFAIAAGSAVAIYGAQWPGGIIGSAGVTGLVAVFVYGRRAQARDNPG